MSEYDDLINKLETKLVVAYKLHAETTKKNTDLQIRIWALEKELKLNRRKDD